MSDGFIQIKLAAEGADVDVDIEVRVTQNGQPNGVIKSRGQGIQEVRVRNFFESARIFEVTSGVTDDKLVYDGPSNAWKLRAPVSPTGRRWVSRTATLRHEASCPAGNGHSLEISVQVLPYLDGEAPDESVALVTREPFFYEVSCS